VRRYFKAASINQPRERSKIASRVPRKLLAINLGLSGAASIPHRAELCAPREILARSAISFLALARIYRFISGRCNRRKHVLNGAIAHPCLVCRYSIINYTHCIIHVSLNLFLTSPAESILRSMRSSHRAFPSLNFPVFHSRFDRKPIKSPRR